jgi:STE24 endopeptidase
MKPVLSILLIVALMAVALMLGSTTARVLSAGDNPSAAAAPASASASGKPVTVSVTYFDVDVANEVYMARLSPQARANSDTYFEV